MVYEVEFVRLPTFENTASGLLPEDEILELEVLLTLDPETGDKIPGSHGLRKVRCPAKGHGKRGGARVIYYYICSRNMILLILAYAKNEMEDLTPIQLKKLSSIIKSELP